MKRFLFYIRCFLEAIVKLQKESAVHEKTSDASTEEDRDKRDDMDWIDKIEEYDAFF